MDIGDSSAQVNQRSVIRYVIKGTACVLSTLNALKHGNRFPPDSQVLNLPTLLCA